MRSEHPRPPALRLTSSPAYPLGLPDPLLILSFLFLQVPEVDCVSLAIRRGEGLPLITPAPERARPRGGVLFWT